MSDERTAKDVNGFRVGGLQPPSRPTDVVPTPPGPPPMPTAWERLSARLILWREPDPYPRPRLFGKRRWEHDQAYRQKAIARNKLARLANDGDEWAREQIDLMELW